MVTPDMADVQKTICGNIWHTEKGDTIGRDRNDDTHKHSSSRPCYQLPTERMPAGSICLSVSGCGAKSF